MAKWRRIASSTTVSDYDIETLWATTSAVPVRREPLRTAVVGAAGLVWMYDSGDFVEFAIAQAILDCDEVHVAEPGVVGVAVGETVSVLIQGWDERLADPFDLAAAPTDPETLYTVLTGGLLTIVDGSHPVRATTIELASRRLVCETSVRLSEGAEFIACDGSVLIAREDRGVLGDRLSVFGAGRDSRLILQIDSAHGSTAWTTEAGVTFLARRELGSDELIAIDPAGAITRRPAPGPVSSLGGGGSCLVAVLGDSDEDVYRLELVDADLRLAPVPSFGGKKQIGRGVDGWITRGVMNGIAFESQEGVHPVPARSALTAPVALMAARTVDGRTRAHRYEGSGVTGTVLHLHGGPDAYETDELRLFGLATAATASGWDWRSLNYRGSRGFDAATTTSAWQHWDETFIEDLRWALDHRVPGPLIIAGWSFGASLALAAARVIAVDGLILGGAMGPLGDHVASAVIVDDNHESWFAERFSLNGADRDFLSGMIPTSRLATTVLSFHGRDDAHCPYELFQQVRAAWTPLVDSWEHHDLPGAGHYADTLDDARLIRNQTRLFLSRVAVGEGSDRPGSSG